MDLAAQSSLVGVPAALADAFGPLQTVSPGQPPSAAIGPLRAGRAGPLQADPAGGGIFALVVTFLITALFYAVTLHLAATFFIGDVPSQRAAYVGPVPAVVSILLGRYGVEGIGFIPPGIAFLLALVATLFADAVAISVSYRISWRPTAILTALHLAFSVALIVPLNNIFQFV